MPLLKHRLFFATTILVILSATAMYSVEARATLDSQAHPASPSPTPPSPVVTTSTSPMVIVSPSNVSATSAGSTFTVQILVKNMAQFDGWDIMVYADNYALNATSLSITGNDFAVNASSGTAFEIVHCINGHGTGCTNLDGRGIVHSAYGNNAILSGNGLLFTITYHVIGTYGYSPINLENDLIFDPSSGNGVPHSAISGTYGVFLNRTGSGGAIMPRA